MTYESWRISYQSSEAAARSAWQEMIRLHHRVNELEAQLTAIGAGGMEPLRKREASTALAVPMAEAWEQSAADTEHQRTGAGLHFNQGVAEGLRICAKDLRTSLAATPAADAPVQDEPSPTAGMNMAQRILHVGGRNNAAGYVEFGSIQAVEALVWQVLRDLLATGGQAQAVERIVIDMKQTAELLDLFGGEPTEFTVMQCNGHSGPGLYAYVTEYPEDGASYLGKTDCEAQPAPQAQAVCGIANKELRTEHAMQLVDAWYEAMKCGSVITRGEARQRIVEFVDALAATHPTQQGLEQPIKWPKARDVGRFGDMSPDGAIRVGLDADNDVYVSIFDGTRVADIEFCTPGGGGGRSSRTRMALIALMCAIEADNASHPAFDFWQRNLAAQAKQGGV